MKQRQILSIIIGLFALGSSWGNGMAQTPAPRQLGDAVQMALSRRAEVQASAQRLHTTENELKANQLRYLPQINAQADVKYNAILATSIVPIGALNPGNPTDEVVAVRFGTNWANGAGLNLRQTIYDPSIRQNRQSVEINGKILEIEHQQTVEAITVEVAKAFYGVLVAEADAQNGTAEIALHAQRLHDLRLRVAEGRALPIDVESAVIDSATVALRYGDLQRNVADWRAILAYQIGLDSAEGANFKMEDALADYVALRADATDGTDHGGTTYALKTLQMQQAIQAQATERAGYKPDLSIVGFLGANHYSNTFDPWKASKWFPTSFIGLNLTVPLTEGFIRQQRVQRLDFLIAAADLDREAALRQRDVEFERAEIARQSAAAAMQAQDAIVQLAIQKWNITVARAAQERATQTEVMAALNDLQLAQTQQLRRKYAWLLADLEIRRLCGLLDF